MPASATAATMTSACASGLGAVSELVRPLCRTAPPLMTAQMRSPSRTASAARFTRTHATPSPRTYPAARASNGRQTPAGLNMPASANTWNGVRDASTFTPPTSASSLSPRRSVSTARHRATSPLEHAVSIASLAPLRLKCCETRLASTAWLTPVPMWVVRATCVRSSNS